MEWEGLYYSLGCVLTHWKHMIEKMFLVKGHRSEKWLMQFLHQMVSGIAG